MNSNSAPVSRPAAASRGMDAFRALHSCHGQTLGALTTLEALVVRLEREGLDAEARAMAAEIVHHFSTVCRQHHEDEERHVLSKLALSADQEIVQAVLRLQQDHDWLEEDWMELSPHLEAVAAGRPWYDVEVLREGVAAFSALSLDHIELEESLIYPQARACLGSDERRAMGREMAARRRAVRVERARGA